jgi:hypothetical protein
MAKILGLQKMTPSAELAADFLGSDVSDHCSTVVPSDVSNFCCITIGL